LLIIFDLDDTLIRTSECITPVKFKSALVRMVSEGCFLDIESDFSLLMDLNARAPSARDAFENFTKQRGIEEKYLKSALHEVYQTSLAGISIPAVEGALEVLLQLKKENYLALVSMGEEERQLDKMEKAGIDSSIFYKISILDGGSKRVAYQELIEDLSISPAEVLVIGDRIPVDLAPAKELGCKTAHIKQGRGVHSRGGEGVVDFTITDPSQIMGVYLKLRQSVN
jgi:FMN phosphatase YigB (HAD superfamily)